MNKKIFIIMQKEVVNVTGGTITVFIDYCNMLSKRGYEIFGLFYANESRRPDKLDKEVNFINLKYIKEEKVSFSEAINYLTEKEKPDLFIFFMPGLYVKSNLNSCFDNIPKILMFHGRPDFYFEIQKNTAKKLKACYKNTISQILVPEYRNFLPDFIKKNPVVYIPNYSSTDCEKVDIDREKKKIIFLSRIAPIKGVDFLVKSFKYVVKAHPDWRLDIYGYAQPPQFQILVQELISKLNLENNVEIKGISKTPLETMLDYDIYVTSSYMEGFPMGLIEAQSVGLPAVGLEECSGVNNLITDKKNGFLTKKNPKDFAKRIIELIENQPLRKQMSFEALNNAKLYENQKVYNMWLKLIDEVINKKQITLNFELNNIKKYKFFPIKFVSKMNDFDENMNFNLFQKLVKFVFCINKDKKDENRIIISTFGIKIKFKKK